VFDTVEASLDRIFAHDSATLEPLIADCCRIKADVVGQDEREAGPRRVLNFGHTIGHALEAVTRFRRFRHGEAVGLGMLAAARVSVTRGLMPADDEDRLQDLIRRMGPLPPVADLRRADALEAAAYDKKITQGRLHFVLCTGLGSTQIVSDVTQAELSDALAAIGLSL
jgi:3-dehydroquinate synthase